MSSAPLEVVTTYVCDCDRTRLTLTAPAELPPQVPDGNLLCTVCGTYTKSYPSPPERPKW